MRKTLLFKYDVTRRYQTRDFDREKEEVRIKKNDTLKHFMYLVIKTEIKYQRRKSQWKDSV